jgi:regulatory protein
LGLLARREHSRRELDYKLRARGFETQAVAAVLAQLEAENLVSDGRFAESYTRHRIASGYGPIRIRKELRERGVSDALISESVDAGDDVWMARLAEAQAKRFGSGSGIDRRERARQARFLEYRGFTADQIRRALDL